MDSVAVTYSWNRMAYIINRSLSERGIKVYTGDNSFITMNRFSILNNKSFCYPSFYSDPKKFIDFLLNYLRKNSISFLIPTHEEIFLISKYIDHFQNIRTLVSDFNSIKIAHKKELSVDLASSLGIGVPDSLVPCSISDCKQFFNQYEKPIVLKYSLSNSSKGVFYINNLSDFEAHYPYIGSFILQQYVKGSGYGVSMLFNKGQKRALFTHKRLEEKIESGGTSTLRISTRNELLENWAELILSHLNWNGIAMVEFKYDEKAKKGWFIEINPRFWGSLALPFYAGMDFPYLYYSILKEGDVSFTSNYKLDVKVKWLLGGFIAFSDSLIRSHKFNFKHLSLNAHHYDDFVINDPFVFIGEIFYYGSKFLNTLQLNPKANSTLNIDNI